MMGYQQLEMSHLTPTTPLSEVVRHTWYGQLLTKFKLSISILRRHQKRRKMYKYGVTWG